MAKESATSPQALVDRQSNDTVSGTAETGNNTVGKKKKKKANSATVSTSGLVQRGPLLLTRQGMSGPAVLKLSAFGARIMNTANYKYATDFSPHTIPFMSDPSYSNTLLLPYFV